MVDEVMDEAAQAEDAEAEEEVVTFTIPGGADNPDGTEVTAPASVAESLGHKPTKAAKAGAKK